MKKIPINFQIKALLTCFIILLISCNSSKKAPPLPLLENEYQQPKTKTFTFSEPDTLQWVTTDASKIKPLPTHKFNWDKLPARPFDIGTPYPLKAPITSKPFDLESLPSTDFDLEKIPKAALNIKVLHLGEPKIVKAANPVTQPQSSRGVSAIDANFGLPGINYCSIKDKDGMLWFGTSNGIARYDGQNIELYGANQGLHMGNVYSMHQDSKDRMWLIGLSKEITVIDFNTNLVYEISSSNDFGTAYRMMEDKEGRIWYSNRYNGYNIVNLEQKWSKQINPTNGLLGTFNICPFQDEEGLIWLTSNRGVNILDLKARKNFALTKADGLLGNFVSSIFQAKDKRIWITQGGGVQILDKKKKEISNITANEGLEGLPAASEVFQDKSGKMWIGSPNGLLFSYSEKTASLEKYELNPTASKYVYHLVEDQQGQIWASIAQGGLYKLDLNHGRPGNFTKPKAQGNDDVWSIIEAKDGKMWIGGYDGIDIYDPKTKTVKHLGKEQGLTADFNTRLLEDSKGRIWSCGSVFGVSIIDPEKEIIKNLTKVEGLKTDTISSILEDKNGLMWMGGSKGEIVTVDLEKAEFKYSLAASTAAQVQNNILVQDQENNIWIGTLDAGIQKINPESNTRVWLNEMGGFISNRVYSLAANNETIWAATHGGVEKINPINNELTTFTTDNGIGANDVYAVLVNNDKAFLGTSNGLTIIKSKNIPDKEIPYWEINTLGKLQGLGGVDFSENSFVIDKNGRFWAGVFPQLFTVIDPIKKDTTAYPANLSGINILDKKQIFYNPKILQEKSVSKDSISKEHELLLYQSRLADSSYAALHNIHWTAINGPYHIPVDLTLPSDQNYISFNYNTLQYTNPDKVVYRYFLEGIDKAWSPISAETKSENYRDLPPGEYTFKVASKGFNNLWSTPTDFSFTILPPWWLTKWAYIAYFLLLLGLIRIVHVIQKERTIRLEREKSQQRELEQAKVIEKAYTDLKATQSQLIQSEKMASLGELTAGIAHEIQNPMNFINNFSEVSNELIEEMQEELDKGDIEEAKDISKDIAQNLQKIAHHGRRASSIVKGMLEHSRTSTGKKEYTDINILADEYLRLAYHGLRAKDKSFNADFKTELDPDLPKVKVIPQDLGRVILNLINNAFFAVTSKAKLNGNADYKPLVTVSTKKQNNKVVLSISDNGTGIPKEVKDKIFQPFFTTKPAGQGTGLGLSLSYDIIKTHGGELKVDTKEGENQPNGHTGTTFNISLPINSK